MKSTLIAVVLAVASFSVHAEILASTANVNGGRMELSNIQCPNGETGMIARAWGGSASDSYGCWTADDNANTITINWYRGGPHTYSQDGWVPTAYGQRVLDYVSGHKGNTANVSYQ